MNHKVLLIDEKNTALNSMEIGGVLPEIICITKESSPKEVFSFILAEFQDVGLVHIFQRRGFLVIETTRKANAPEETPEEALQQIEEEIENEIEEEKESKNVRH